MYADVIIILVHSIIYKWNDYFHVIINLLTVMFPVRFEKRKLLTNVSNMWVIHYHVIIESI